MPSILPDPDEFADLAPRPGSPVWRAFNDGRMMSTAGYASLLQVCHPTVGAGVHEYSSFTKDPLGRLLRTLDYINGTIYGGPEMAGEIGRRVRAMHTSIKGTTHEGKRYHAMEPGAFAWVHATLAAGIFEGHRRLIKPMSRAEKDAFWTEWMGVGRLIGVRTRDLPEEAGDFPAYFDDVVENELTWTPAVPEVLATYDLPLPRPVGVPSLVWSAVKPLVARHTQLATVGFLPPVMRERLDLKFSRRDAIEFELNCRLIRASGPLQPPQMRRFGENWVTWRRRALERGDVAAPRTLTASPAG